MKVWTCTDHDTMYPVGGASVVIAENESEARLLLDKELRENGCNPDKGYTLQEVDLSKAQAIVLNNGDY